MCGNEYLQLRIIDNPGFPGDGYTYFHEIRCDGKIVSILPFKMGGNDRIQFLLHRGVTPAWTNDPILTSITGGMEEGSPILTAVREMKEEAGYEIEESDLIELGSCYGVKCADTLYYLYGVDLSEKQPGDNPGDGSSGEEYESTVWVSFPESDDPLVSTLILRLLKSLGVVNF